MKQRQFERIECKASALINYQGGTFGAEVINLSLKGLFVRTDEKIGLNEPVQITVYFNGTSGGLSFVIDGKVVHRDEKGIGLSFHKINTSSLVHSLPPAKHFLNDSMAVSAA